MATSWLKAHQDLQVLSCPVLNKYLTPYPRPGCRCCDCCRRGASTATAAATATATAAAAATATARPGRPDVSAARPLRGHLGPPSASSASARAPRPPRSRPPGSPSPRPASPPPRLPGRDEPAVKGQAGAELRGAGGSGESTYTHTRTRTRSRPLRPPHRRARADSREAPGRWARGAAAIVSSCLP